MKKDSILYKKFETSIKKSKQKDIKKNRIFDEFDYIDIEFLYIQYKLQKNHCYYCDKFMARSGPMNDDKMTIERLDDTLPHIKTNCVLACFYCNILRSK